MVGVIVLVFCNYSLMYYIPPLFAGCPTQRNQACTVIEAEGRGAQRRALGRLEAAAIIVQAGLARGCAGRKVAYRARELREMARAHTRTQWAVSLLQARYWGEIYIYMYIYYMVRVMCYGGAGNVSGLCFF